jgi:hypothetical protein
MGARIGGRVVEGEHGISGSATDSLRNDFYRIAASCNDFDWRISILHFDTVTHFGTPRLPAPGVMPTDREITGFEAAVTQAFGLAAGT